MEAQAGIITGLQTEARIARVAKRARVLCRGMGPKRAREAAEELVRAGVSGLVSFGYAAGLAAEARPGLLVVPARIVADGGGEIATDLLWRERLLGRLAGHVACSDAPLAAVKQPLLSYLDKAAAWARMQAIAADMESAAIAAVARRARLPFIALRAVVDPAEFPLPTAALMAVDKDGRLRPFRLLKAIWRQPRQIKALKELAGHAKKARASLLLALELAGASLAMPQHGRIDTPDDTRLPQPRDEHERH